MNCPPAASREAKKEYDKWETSSPKTIDKIDELITDILESGFLHSSAE